MPARNAPGPADLTPIQYAWLDFTRSVRVLLVPRPDDRPLDQYLAFRDSVFEIVQGPQFLEGLQQGWAPFTDEPQQEIGRALLLELEAFPRAVEVAQATEGTLPTTKAPAPGPWWRRLLGRASTVTGSVRDLLETLPPYVKGGLTLFNELIDLFRKDG